MTAIHEPWWKSAVVYQIYPRSFADSNDDGVGDLEGIRLHLDHLENLGVDAIWISPFFTSPMADFGYDVADYCDVDPLFGDLAEFDHLVADCHRQNIRVLIDWVPNHTSDQHPWFVESRSSTDNPRRDWYWWRDPAPGGGPPNNWQAAFLGLPAWTLDTTSGQYYLHLFLPEQPDLNWHNPDVEAAMHDTLRFWLDRGVDGFRMDVIHMIGKDPALPDFEADPSHQHTGSHDYPATHGMLRRIRQVLDEYPGDRVSVGEVFILSTAKVAEYYGAGDELHLAFNFPALFAPWEARAWRRRIERVAEELEPRDAWPTWVLSNHDTPRHRTRYGGSETRARAAAVLLLTQRGTPFLYQGEELGLEDADVPDDRRVDPGGRDGCRAPIPWTADARHGWGVDDTVEPWLPWPPEPGGSSVEVQEHDPASMLALYRRLLSARRGSPALHLGALRLIDVADDVVAFERADGSDRRLVLINFASEPRAVGLDEEWRVEVASDGAGEGDPFSGELLADQAVVLRPT